jgi:hypothetical protein
VRDLILIIIKLFSTVCAIVKLFHVASATIHNIASTIAATEMQLLHVRLQFKTMLTSDIKDLILLKSNIKLNPK